MARLPALIDALAKVDGRERAPLEALARVVREGGLIATTKRGSGAAMMVVKDAANLLLAAKLSWLARTETTAATMQFRSLARLEANDCGRALGGVLGDLASAPTLGGALELLISKAKVLEAEFDHWTVQNWEGLPQSKRDRLAFPYLEIELTSAPFARILAGYDRGEGLQVEAVFDFVLLAGHDHPPGPFGRREPLDTYYAVRFGLQTLIALHDVIMPRTAR